MFVLEFSFLQRESFILEEIKSGRERERERIYSFCALSLVLRWFRTSGSIFNAEIKFRGLSDNLSGGLFPSALGLSQHLRP